MSIDFKKMADRFQKLALSLPYKHRQKEALFKRSQELYQLAGVRKYES